MRQIRIDLTRDQAGALRRRVTAVRGPRVRGTAWLVWPTLARTWSDQRAAWAGQNA